MRFREGYKPWDAGGVPAALREFLVREPAPRVLVPGCGSGYEVQAFAAAGHDVVAIDFSPAAIEAARHVLGELGRVLVQGDFFAHPLGEFDLVYERAFLCALPRPHWPRWAARIAEVIRPGGRLAGFFFWSDDERGPPFGLKRGELEASALERLRPDRGRSGRRLDPGVRRARALAGLASALTVLRHRCHRPVASSTPLDPGADRVPVAFPEPRDPCDETHAPSGEMMAKRDRRDVRVSRLAPRLLDVPVSVPHKERENG